jgi:hypothetical protein
VREEPSGLRAWFGSWRDPRPAHTLRAGAAILRLPKGQEGDVIIGKIHVGSRTVERASFRGQGAAPDRGAD